MSLYSLRAGYACPGVHTDLKMTTYVLWCNTQEYKS